MLDTFWLSTNFWCAGGSLFTRCVLLLHPQQWLVIGFLCASVCIFCIIIITIVIDIIFIDIIITSEHTVNGPCDTSPVACYLLMMYEPSELTAPPQNCLHPRNWLGVIGSCRLAHCVWMVCSQCFVYSIICIKSFVCCFVIIPLNTLDVHTI